MDREPGIGPARSSVVSLAPGRHASPREGVCVVELASLVAGETFSDRPRCVCPVIGAFLRAWNDRAAYADRQRLRPYAARIVGSRDERVVEARRMLCIEWARAELRRHGVRHLLGKAGIRARIAILFGARAALRPNEGAGGYAARLAFARGDTDAAFALLDRLLAEGDDRSRVGDVPEGSLGPSRPPDARACPDGARRRMPDAIGSAEIEPGRGRARSPDRPRPIRSRAAGRL